MILYLTVFILLIFISLNIFLQKENFYVKKRLPVALTWTPYVVDFNNQPAYSNYFYNNGYMYPVY